MIDSLNTPPYIISFPQGASGRFAKYLLHNLLTDSDLELHLCPVTNSTHRTDDKIKSGYSKNFGDNSRPDIWELFQFDAGATGCPRIFATHQWPNFKLIRERLGNDVKIIIITVDPFDLPEVMINDRVKNTYDLLNGKSPDPLQPSMEQLATRYARFLNKYYPGRFVLDDIIQIARSMALDLMPYFVKRSLRSGAPLSGVILRCEQFVFAPAVECLDYPMDQVLYLPYHDLYKDWIWLQKLEAFTGKTSNTATRNSYQRYMDGRVNLVKKYRL